MDLILPLSLPVTALQEKLLLPLFNQSPTSTPSLYIHLTSLILALALSRYPTTWHVYYYIAGVSLILSQKLLDLSALHLLKLGAITGPLVGRLLIETIYKTCRDLLVINALKKSRNYVNLIYVTSSVVLLVSINASLFTYFPSLQLVSHSYLLSIAGALLASIGALTPTPTNRFIISQLPSSRLLALVALLFCVYLSSPFVPSPSLPPNPSHKLLASELGISGHLTVGEYTSRNQTMRYLRADHSLLGGLWIGASRDQVVAEMEASGISLWAKVDEVEVVRRAESIYSTFILQEVCRLVVRTPPPSSSTLPVQEKETALVIGLGIGIIARSLEAHNVTTSIVELDPLVVQLAQEHFGVEGERIFIEDARSYLDRERDCAKFDHIVHDVFTGGSLPSSLFTSQTFSHIRSLLRPNGVLTVNYAGSMSSRTTSIVLSTLVNSFPLSRCRAFEDGGVVTADGQREEGGYKNLVIFCSNVVAPEGPLLFRPALPEDYIGNLISPFIRQRVYETFQRFEIDLRDFWSGGKRETVGLRDGEEWRMERALVQDSFEHWEIMSRVLPNEIWAAY